MEATNFQSVQQQISMHRRIDVFAKSTLTKAAYDRGQELGYPLVTLNGNMPIAITYACGHEARYDVWPQNLNHDGVTDDRSIELLQAKQCPTCRENEKRRADEDRIKRRRRAEYYHDKLYDRAMQLAVDEDDMDVVEHYCQGHIDRLKEFIAAREK